MGNADLFLLETVDTLTFWLKKTQVDGVYAQVDLGHASILLHTSGSQALPGDLHVERLLDGVNSSAPSMSSKHRTEEKLCQINGVQDILMTTKEARLIGQRMLPIPLIICGRNVTPSGIREKEKDHSVRT